MAHVGAVVVGAGVVGAAAARSLARAGLEVGEEGIVIQGLGHGVLYIIWWGTLLTKEEYWYLC